MVIKQYETTDMISEMFFNANLEELGLETRVSMFSASTYITQTFRDCTAFKSNTDIYSTPSRNPDRKSSRDSTES